MIVQAITAVASGLAAVARGIADYRVKARAAGKPIVGVTIAGRNLGTTDPDNLQVIIALANAREVVNSHASLLREAELLGE